MYFGQMEINILKEGCLQMRSFYEDTVMNNEMITTYFLNKEETDKIFFAAGIERKEPEKELYELFKSAYDFECFAVKHGIHFRWHREWDYPVLNPPSSGTDADCLAKYMEK